MMRILLSALAVLFLSVGAANAAELSSGPWAKQETKISGTWSVVEKADGTYIMLDENFKTRKAPDLKIFLSKQSPEAITGSNATDGSVFVAKLERHKGAQSYKLPAGVNLSDFNSIVLHCEQYSKLWGASAL